MAFAKIDCASNGDNTIVAAVSGMRIVVTSYVLVVANAVGAQWRTGTSADLSGSMSFAANGGVSVSHPGNGGMGAGVRGVMQTAVGEALILKLTGGIQVSGHLTYELVP